MGPRASPQVRPSSIVRATPLWTGTSKPASLWLRAVAAVATRRVEELAQALGCEGISKGQVSRICQELDTVVDSFLDRPLDGRAHPYLWLDAMTQKVGEDGRVVT